MDDFAEEWNYGISQIGERTDSAVQALDQIGKSFDECDRVLGDACRGSSGPPWSAGARPVTP